MLTKADLAAIGSLVDQKLEKRLSEFREEIIQFKDEILKEIKDLREEVIIVSGYIDTLEDHELRITQLEEHAKQ